jgi:hypothetical protein
MRIPPSQLEQWDEIDLEMMLALADVERDICSGCGGYLSKTTVHDHGYRVHTKSCGRCEALAKFAKGQAVIDEFFEGTPQAEIAEARKLFVEPIPIPDSVETKP